MSSATPSTAPEYWDRYKPYRGEGEQPPPAAARFEWTDVPGHGPGAEVLGSPGTALDLGPAEGENAAVLARAGTAVTAVDFSLTQVERARRLWRGAAGLDFVLAEACTFLDNDPRTWDAIYSTWGAVWFTDPDDLLPRVARRLAPSGVFAFSHRAPAVNEYGAQAMGGPWLEGREGELTVRRWQYTIEQWSDILKRTGFADISAQVLLHPEPGRQGTLLVQARRGN
ncbi:class I SAM-dependent methyltransferase [Streptomyces sp. BH-SS-21]|uniref:Class I SAM-dependent methyltransferase n=1 Tax=Streptomyces liliiviolaceus TaxID=2823109 RepID=A0A940XWQ9_9ACTN|nr:class I SAM-dependent methyltransferase [Streptomyces liliiviolaceus]MBQ0850323.1 class I SAM-dependent methyltransferase [Streptomyces liliiviolaceus]